MFGEGKSMSVIGSAPPAHKEPSDPNPLSPPKDRVTRSYLEFMDYFHNRPGDFGDLPPMLNNANDCLGEWEATVLFRVVCKQFEAERREGRLVV